MPLHIWEICIPRSVQAKQILIGRFVECQSLKNVGGRRSVEELYQALFFVSPFPPECFTERNEIEPDCRLERCYTTGERRLRAFNKCKQLLLWPLLWKSYILLFRFLKFHCFNAGNRVKFFQESIPRLQFCR